jgi:hypothetical protein
LLLDDLSKALSRAATSSATSSSGRANPSLAVERSGWITGAAAPPAAGSAQRELRSVLASGVWSKVSALVPADGEFLVASGEEADDPVAVLRILPRDPRPELLITLMQRPGRIDGVTRTVWPKLAVRDQFVIDDAERPDLKAAFGAKTVAA